jgi:hypothetical protein
MIGNSTVSQCRTSRKQNWDREVDALTMDGNPDLFKFKTFRRQVSHAHVGEHCGAGLFAEKPVGGAFIVHRFACLYGRGKKGWIE